MRPLFGYNIQRDYDLQWFTPVTIIGGLIGIVFFSLINLASNGYDLALTYTTDPQKVLANKPWYLSWSWDKHLQSNCSDQNIPVGAQVFTTNLGFTYTVTAVGSADPGDPNNTGVFGSLPYQAQPLENCIVESVFIDLHKGDQSVPGPMGKWLSWDDSSAWTTARCTVKTHSGWQNVQLQAHYKPTASMYNYVIHMDYKNSSSIWWGTRLLNLYWYGTLTAMSQQLFGIAGSPELTKSPAWTKGNMAFIPTGTVDDITRPDFFSATYFFLAADGRYVNQDTEKAHVTSLLFNNASAYPYSEALTEGLGFARVMYSAILVDLGSTSSPNVLLNETLLRWILSHPDDTFRNDPDNVLNATRQCSPAEAPPACYDHYGLISIISSPNMTTIPNATDLNDRTKSQLMNASYDAYKSQLGPLRTGTNATIFEQYACQVPQRKPFATVILPLLVADLVFLQVCWKLLNLAAVGWTKRKHKDTAMWCEGCLKMHANPESRPTGDVEMDHFQRRRAKSSVGRASHGTHASYLSLASNGSEDTVAHSERGDDAKNKAPRE